MCQKTLPGLDNGSAEVPQQCQEEFSSIQYQSTITYYPIHSGDLPIDLTEHARVTTINIMMDDARWINRDKEDTAAHDKVV